MKILIIDDQRDIPIFLKEYLDDHGHETEICFNGRDGLEHLKKNNYDIVFTDHNMPEVSGLEIAKYARQHALKAKVVIISGYPVINETFSKSLGADKFITKPFDFDLIGKIVSEYEREKSE